jgi:hypothetical protein
MARLRSKVLKPDRPLGLPELGIIPVFWEEPKAEPQAIDVETVACEEYDFAELAFV